MLIQLGLQYRLIARLPIRRPRVIFHNAEQCRGNSLAVLVDFVVARSYILIESLPASFISGDVLCRRMDLSISKERGDGYTHYLLGIGRRD